MGEKTYPNRVIDRVVGLLGCFSSEQRELTLSELAEKVDISRPTALRLLSSLTHHRLLQQDPETKRYRLGLGLFELGNVAATSLTLVEVSAPRLQELVRITGETANLAVMDEGMATYVAKVEGSFSMRIASRVGLRVPCHCAGLGKVLLAYDEEAVEQHYSAEPFPRRTARTITTARRLQAELERIRQRGYAMDDEEFEDGVRCIAAPVFDHSGSAVAAMSVSGPVGRITDDVAAEWSEHLIGMAQDLSAALGHR
jgi:DNA-binding IclR family transcriptional regulator